MRKISVIVVSKLAVLRYESPSDNKQFYFIRLRSLEALIGQSRGCAQGKGQKWWSRVISKSAMRDIRDGTSLHVVIY